MNTTQQTLHLLNFHRLTTPIYFWLLLTLPLWLSLYMNRLGLDSFGEMRDFFPIIGLIYLPILAIQAAWGIQTKHTRNNPQIWGSGWRHFFASQPINRNSLYFANSIVFVLAITIMVAGLLIPTVWNPDYTLSFYNAERASEAYTNTYKPAFEDASQTQAGERKHLIILPGARWHMAAMTVAIICFVSICGYWLSLATRKSEKQNLILISLFFTMTITPLLVLNASSSYSEAFEYQNRLFFFIQNQPLIWLAIVVLATVAWLDGRSRFIKNF